MYIVCSHALILLLHVLKFDLKPLFIWPNLLAYNKQIAIKEVIINLLWAKYLILLKVSSGMYMINVSLIFIFNSNINILQSFRLNELSIFFRYFYIFNLFFFFC